MSDFEKDILGFIPALHDESVLAEQQRLEELRQQEAARQIEHAETERIRSIGRQAAAVLIAHNIPTIPVLKSTDQSGAQPGFARGRLHVADGWHVFHKTYVEYIQDAEFDRRHNFSLRTDGTLETFAYEDPNPNMTTIKDPKPVDRRSALELLENDGFKKALAHLIGGFGVAKYEHL